MPPPTRRGSIPAARVHRFGYARIKVILKDDAVDPLQRCLQCRYLLHDLGACGRTIHHRDDGFNVTPHRPQPVEHLRLCASCKRQPSSAWAVSLTAKTASFPGTAEYGGAFPEP